jgi:hypothetical protein
MLLPTPVATETGSRRDLDKRVEDHRQLELSDIVRLLPTPTTATGSDGKNQQGGPSLNSISKLMADETDDSTSSDPTPQRSNDGNVSWVEQPLTLRSTTSSPQPSPSGSWDTPKDG